MPRLTELELRLLIACRDAVSRQQEMLPQIAQMLGVVADEEVFYAWTSRQFQQRWTLPGTDWKCFFHGMECDLENAADGRLLRIDFGPSGRVDTFTMWGVLRFVMTSTAPWPEYQDLKTAFSESGTWTNTTAIESVWDRLEELGMFEPADETLLDFRESYTTIGADGLQHVDYPPGTPESVQMDCAVAHRLILSDAALRLLEDYRTIGTNERVVPGAI